MPSNGLLNLSSHLMHGYFKQKYELKMGGPISLIGHIYAQIIIFRIMPFHFLFKIFQNDSLK